MKMFVNLPVKNLEKSMEFFTKLDFKFDPRFTDDKATCMIVGRDIFVMLIIEEFFKTFTTKKINEAAKSTEVILSLSVQGRDKVDPMVNRAIAAGATKSMEPKDYGFMYQNSFYDLDGHMWEVFHMDLRKMKAAMNRDE
jgi:uncharacterized protein